MQSWQSQVDMLCYCAPGTELHRWSFPNSTVKEREPLVIAPMHPAAAPYLMPWQEYCVLALFYWSHSLCNSVQLASFPAVEMTTMVSPWGSWCWLATHWSPEQVNHFYSVHSRNISPMGDRPISSLWDLHAHTHTLRSTNNYCLDSLSTNQSQHKAHAAYWWDHN